MAAPRAVSTVGGALRGTTTRRSTKAAAQLRDVVLQTPNRNDGRLMSASFMMQRLPDSGSMKAAEQTERKRQRYMCTNKGNTSSAALQTAARDVAMRSGRIPALLDLKSPYTHANFLLLWWGLVVELYETTTAISCKIN